jgi:2-dehydro-3-deoxy-D-arabinonate dehydratase
MILVRYRDRSGEVHIGHTVDGITYRLPVGSLAELLAGDLASVRSMVAAAGPADRDVARLLAPVDGATEVWAAGVTYLRSRDARIEESVSADPYERVYRAERPELFFKSAAWRVRGPDEAIAIRADSDLDVPEPELAVVVTASGEIAGYTICDDVSSRSIEGENPLYLPQAKTYAGSCALGPGIVPAWTVADPLGLEIGLTVTRESAVVFSAQTTTRQLAREPADLVRWLFAEQDFPAGAVLSTGTGIVPGLGFSLQAGDQVTIQIDGVGTLSNPVVRGKDALAKADS